MVPHIKTLYLHLALNRHISKMSTLKMICSVKKYFIQVYMSCVFVYYVYLGQFQRCHLVLWFVTHSTFS